MAPIAVIQTAFPCSQVYLLVAFWNWSATKCTLPRFFLPSQGRVVLVALLAFSNALKSIRLCSEANYNRDVQLLNLMQQCFVFGLQDLCRRTGAALCSRQNAHVAEVEPEMLAFHACPQNGGKKTGHR